SLHGVDQQQPDDGLHQSAKQCRDGRARSAVEVAGLEVQRGSTLRLYRRPGTYGERGLQEHSHQAAVIHSITSARKNSVGSPTLRVSSGIRELHEIIQIMDAYALAASPAAAPTRGIATRSNVSRFT